MVSSKAQFGPMMLIILGAIVEKNSAKTLNSDIQFKTSLPPRQTVFKHS
jgi:hypothetical protein